MESSILSLETLYDLDIIVSRIKSESLNKIILQTPNTLLSDIFQFKRSLLAIIPNISINVLCDKHVFFPNYIVFII